jgi:hypothetical protein
MDPKFEADSDQVVALRTLLPDKLVDPTKTATGQLHTISPRHVATSLRDAVVTGNKDIQAFKASYQSDDMKDLWQKVNSSSFPQGDDSWISKYSELANGSLQDQNVNAQQKVIDSISSSAANDAEIQDGFLKDHSSIRLKRSTEGQAVPFEITVNGLIYKIERSEKDGLLRASLSSSSSEGRSSASIVKHVNSQQLNSMEAILSLLLSYNRPKTTKCQKCGKIFDSTLNFPLVRQRKSEQPLGSDQAWIALHESCIT